MSSETPNRPLPRHPRIWWSRIVWKWPILVWLAVAGLAFWLFDHGGDYRRINGMVEVTTESVAPLETGRLIQIHVIPGQQVEAGQVVAQLDASLVDVEIALLSQRIQQERADDERRFTTAEERLREELRDYVLEETKSQLELNEARVELEQLEELAGTGFAGPGKVAALRTRCDSLSELIELYAGYRKELDGKLHELAAIHEASVSYHTEQEEGGAGVSQLNLLRRRRAELTLRAQQSGVVSRIRREPGEVLRAGERVVDIITSRPRRILAFMNEVDTRPVRVGDILEVEPAIGGERFKVRIEALSPNLISLEDRASPIPERLVRGRRLELVPLEEVSLTPGASMVVFLPTKARVESFLGGNPE